MRAGETQAERTRGADGSGRGGGVPTIVGRCVARVYSLEIGRRNRRYDRGEGVTRLDRPVISVGNLSVGGTGKTPMVAFIVDALLRAGRRPCIAMRGYRARGGESDEAGEYARRFGGGTVAVVAQADRIAGLRALFRAEGNGAAARAQGRAVDCVVLDDGFQHRRIARDLDIVLLDATRDPFEDRLLPAGRLRERVGSLARADVIAITHAEASSRARVESIAERAREINPGATLGVCRHVWRGLVSEGGEEREVEWLSGRRALGVCAIGNPGPFLAELERRAGRAAGAIVLRDHDPYAGRTIERIIGAARARGADVIVCTEKDWSKLRRAWPGRPPCEIVRPILEIGFERGGAEVLRRVLEAAGARGGVEREVAC